MSNTIDVRDDIVQNIENIRFADYISKGNGQTHAYLITTRPNYEGVVLYDDEYETGGCDGFVLVSDKEHAENLIKALNKAIELGWLK